MGNVPAKNVAATVEAGEIAAARVPDALTAARLAPIAANAAAAWTTSNGAWVSRALVVSDC